MLPRTTIARSAHQIAGIETLWRRCLAADEHATFFQRFEWNLASARYFSDREQPYVIAVEAEQGATIIPAAIAADTCTLLGEALTDYRGILTTDPEGQSMAIAWEVLAQANLPLRFTALRPEHHLVFDQLSTQAFVGAPYLIEINAGQFAHDHNRMFSRLRKLQRLGFELTARSAADSEFLRWLYRCKADADPESLFHDPLRIEMLVEAFAALKSDVEITTIERQGQIISAAIALRDRGHLRFYTNWYDTGWAHYSPGMVLLYEMTRRALDAGRACDYMTGEQPYKLRMANGIAPLRRVEASVVELREAAEWLSRRSPFVVPSV